jgi:hypothetical protein
MHDALTVFGVLAGVLSVAVAVLGIGSLFSLFKAISTRVKPRGEFLLHS